MDDLIMCNSHIFPASSYLHVSSFRGRFVCKVFHSSIINASDPSFPIALKISENRRLVVKITIFLTHSLTRIGCIIALMCLNENPKMCQSLEHPG